ncbi:hypothetical protein B9N43_01975 [Denitratisoma sp. DHT3]|uniref:enoyl-CoA hydratase/isomerase family protein n=1 Tax=Denitratisoma sp. DHT3 TaxID=1981880 RepID=UPI0011987960|nr:enoyl-CoA hydratase/isomerase family protein [Denitratisoma sp. DHT3]QDX80131.1 hypothetical protein B9N43_01975 [Denitratisoma sp. DHT3]
MTFPVPILSVDELLDACANPWGLDAYSPLTGHPCLLLDLSRPVPMERTDEAVRALLGMPCPTLGFGASPSAAQPDGIVAALDVVLESPDELPGLLRNIQANPLAAATLAHVLRHNSHAGIEDGLLAESLAYATLQGSQEFRRFLAGRPAPLLDRDEHPLLTERQGDILHITLNRPAKRNAYSAGMRDALYETLRWLEADDTLARAEIRGAGSCFCTGGDLDEFGLATDPAQAHLVRMSRPVGLLISRLAQRIECHVHRACIGSGIELPAFAGRVTATADTFFQLPEVAMGLIPGAGGTVGILRRIGRQRMAYWVLSGRRIKATTALEWGLIDAIV